MSYTIPTNGTSELVQTDGSGDLPALSAVNLTDLPGANLLANSVANAALATMPGLTLKGNDTGAAATPSDLTVSQAMTLLGAAPLASPAFTGVPTAPTAAPGTNTPQVATTAFVAAAVATAPFPPVAQCRLSYVSATQIVLLPYNGNLIDIDGSFLPVPALGVALANTGLTAATLYYVYVYDSGGGTLALEASTTGHTVNATTGLPQKSGDSSRLFVGWVYPGAGTPGTFVDSVVSRTVVSYFNRRPRDVQNTSSDVITSTTPTILGAPGSTIYFIATGDDAFQPTCSGNAANPAVGYSVYLQIGIDGSVVGFPSASVSVAGGTALVTLSCCYSATLAEGIHTLNPFGWVNSGTGSFTVVMAATIQG